MGNMRGIALLLFICSTCGIVSCDDSGLLPTELSQTLARLQRQPRQGGGGGRSGAGVRTTSDLAIPTSAYANAYADMRSPDPAAMPNPFASAGTGGIGGLKLSKLPSFALQQVANEGPRGDRGTRADLRTPHVSDPIKLGIPDALLKAVAPQGGGGARPASPTSELLADPPPAADSVLRALTGEDPSPKSASARGGGGGARPVGLEEAGAASSSPPAVGGGGLPAKEAAVLAEKRKQLAALQRRPAAAAARLVSSGHGAVALSVGGVEDRKGGALGRVADKHRALAINALAGPRGDGGAPPVGSGGGKSLDSSVKSYHGYLASAVMVLAGLAGTAICGGICAVTYCYANREKGLSDVGEDGQRGEKKYYGRPTAQYGSYGSAMRRTV